MTTPEVEVVGQDAPPVPAEEEEPTGLTGLLQRLTADIRSGNLGVLPIVDRLAVPGSISIQDRWINYTGNYYFSHLAGWLIAALVVGGYAASALFGVIGKIRAGISVENRGLIGAKIAAVAVAGFGVVAI